MKAGCAAITLPFGGLDGPPTPRYRPVSYTRLYPPTTFRTALEIASDGGLIEFDSAATAPIDLLLNTRGDSAYVGLPSSPVLESPYTTEIKEFYAALADDLPVRVSAADGLAAVQIALAAESARTGQPVALAPLPEVQR